MDDQISRNTLLRYVADWQYSEAIVGNEAVYDTIEKFYHMVEEMPSAQPEQIARDIATIIENEKDMRVILKNAEHMETHSCDCEHTETHESRREWYMRGYRDAQPKWIPIKWHDCTAEEREEYGFGEEIVTVFDCDMPSDNQEILVTTSHGYVEKDVCYIDDGYSLDSGYDWIEDITAWKPLPEPYKEGAE